MALIKTLSQEREGALPLLLVMVIICSQTFLRKRAHLPAFILCLENVQQACLRYFLFFSSSSIFKKAVFPSPSVSGKWNPSGEGSALWEIRWHTWKVLITQLNVTKCMELTQSHQGSKRSFLKTLHIISITTLEGMQLSTICPFVLYFPHLILGGGASTRVDMMILTLVHLRSLTKFACVAKSKANPWAAAIDYASVDICCFPGEKWVSCHTNLSAQLEADPVEMQ